LYACFAFVKQVGEVIPVGLAGLVKLVGVHEEIPVSQSDEFLSIDTPENVIFDYEVVGIGTRFIAALVDTLLIAITLIVVNLTTILLLNQFLNEEIVGSWVAALAGMFSFVVIWGYYIFFELRWNGQSPGKRWTHIRVIRRNGTPITLIESIVRNLVRIVDFLPVAYGAGIVTMFIHPQSCRLGDLAAGTLVVREQEEVALSSLGERPVLRSYLTPGVEEQVHQWPIERLSNDDLQLASDFLQRRHGLANQNALALTIVRRLLAKMEMPDEALRESDAPFVLASIVKAARASPT
jgi:uncharacterized RDD family membrane protein YckC